MAKNAERAAAAAEVPALRQRIAQLEEGLGEARDRIAELEAGVAAEPAPRPARGGRK